MIRIRQINQLKNFLNRLNGTESILGTAGQRRFGSEVKKDCGPGAKLEYMDLQCKIALITGGATGIGLAIANEFLSQQAYRVIISGIDPCVGKAAAKHLNDSHGKDKCCFIHMNVTCPKQFEDVFKEITDKFGGVDILVNNAGVMQDKKWEYEIDVNMKSVVRGTLVAMKYMQCQKRKGGIVINNSDALAFDTLPHAPIYVGTKYGVLGLSRSFGDKVHFKETGVRVVALTPGVTDTDMLKDAEGNQLEKPWGKQAVATLIAKPMQRPSVVGKAAAYIVRYAPPGSAWLVEDSQLFKAKVPNRKTYLEKVAIL